MENIINIIKLSNGETIVGYLIHEDADITSIIDPLALIIDENDKGRPMLLAMTWIPLLKETTQIDLKTTHVVAISECDEDIAKYYLKSLAIMKGDIKKLKELVSDDSNYVVDDDYDDDDDEEDLWMKKFGKQMIFTANTVH
jgi:hypothetical protein